jgi:hypothetical protein
VCVDVMPNAACAVVFEQCDDGIVHIGYRALHDDSARRVCQPDDRQQ